MARKEIKGELGQLRKSVVTQRSEIAALKRDIKVLTTQVRGLSKEQERAAAAGRQQTASQNSKSPPKQQRQHDQGLKATEGAGRKERTGRAFVFNHEALIAKRQALGLTQKEMAKLLGISVVSIYKWETDKVTPRAAQLERVREVLKLGVRAARKQIAE
ncbi:MAG TPA: helix-turn-helix transcriptional regulator [Alicycliphilus sp.]|nr:helix-turn-helix transcriptional regulator [Alicycliphilus sp.]